MAVLQSVAQSGERMDDLISSRGLTTPSRNERPGGTEWELRTKADDATDDGAPDETSRGLRRLIYLDPWAFTRDCIGRWLQSHLSGFSVWPCQIPEKSSPCRVPAITPAR